LRLQVLLQIFTLGQAFANSNEEKRREGKLFSLFNIVTFPNDQCTSGSSNAIQGTCFTEDECRSKGGNADGNCASGFGVCCTFFVSATGSRITNNCTYIDNPGAPTTYGTTAAQAGMTFAYTVEGGPSVCQTRLDFVNAVLRPPLNAVVGLIVPGTCNQPVDDTLTVTSPSTTLVGIENLCGTISGQHIYVHNDGSNQVATININIGTATSPRQWRIKVSMLDCDSDSLAPDGCLQYHTGPGGRITSFNGGFAGAQTIVNQQYNICLRQELGMCKFNVREFVNVPDSFQLQSATANVGSVGAVQCAISYIDIPSTDVRLIPASEAVGVPTVVVDQVSRYCGTVLTNTDGQLAAGVVTSNVLPFRIGVRSASTLTAQPSSFDLVYNQIPC